MAMEIFKLVGSIMVDSDQAQQSISKTEEKTVSLGQKMASGVKTAAKWGLGIATAAAGIGAAMLKTAKSTASTLDEIDKGAKRMKISAESYQEMSYMAELCGVSMSTLETAAKKISDMDLSLDDAIEQLAAITDESERSQAAIDLFGESVAYQLTPLLSEGADSLAAMKQEANDLGIIMSSDTVSAGASLNDTFTKVEESIGSIKTEIMTAMMPAIQGILDWVLEHMPEIRETIKGVVENVTGFFDDIIKKCDEMGVDWDALWSGMRAVLDVILPIISAAISAFIYLLEKAITLFKECINAINEYNRQIAEQGAEVSYWYDDTGMAHEMILPTGTMPNAGINDTNPLANGSISANTKARESQNGYYDDYGNWYPNMASGGILEKGQIGFLEGNGAEAVVPLENNSKWIGAVANEMNGAFGGAEISAKLDRMIALLADGRNLYIDSDVLVGATVGKIDMSLGSMRTMAMRTN